MSGYTAAQSKLLASIGATEPGDVLAPVLTNQMNIKNRMSGPAVDAAKVLLARAGYTVSGGSEWDEVDTASVAAYQKDNSLPRTGMFDAPVLTSLRRNAPPPGSAGTGKKKDLTKILGYGAAIVGGGLILKKVLKARG